MAHRQHCARMPQREMAQCSDRAATHGAHVARQGMGQCVHRAPHFQTAVRRRLRPCARTGGANYNARHACLLLAPKAERMHSTHSTPDLQRRDLLRRRCCAIRSRRLRWGAPHPRWRRRCSGTSASSTSPLERVRHALRFRQLSTRHTPACVCLYRRWLPTNPRDRIRGLGTSLRCGQAGVKPWPGRGCAFSSTQRTARASVNPKPCILNHKP